MVSRNHYTSSRSLKGSGAATGRALRAPRMALEAAENIARASRRLKASSQVLESVEALVLVAFRSAGESWGALAAAE